MICWAVVLALAVSLPIAVLAAVLTPQLQLAQPLFTIAWAALLLGEHVGPVTLFVAVGVLCCVAATQRSRVIVGASDADGSSR